MSPTPKDLASVRKDQGVHHHNGHDDDSPPLPPVVIERLGELLREFYCHLTAQPIPEHLRRLLDQLDHKRKADHGH